MSLRPHRPSAPLHGHVAPCVGPLPCHDTDAVHASPTLPFPAPPRSYSRGQRYLEGTVSLARSTVPGEDVCIGAGTSIGGWI